jgi:tRNA dimethylallyltransferase
MIENESGKPTFYPAAGSKAFIAALVGPTAVGKTAVAVELAQITGAAIISVDSRQIYSHIELGTGKPSSQQRRHAEHFLVDLVFPANIVSADQCARWIHCLVKYFTLQNRSVLLVGGTGLWLWSYLHGMDVLPPADPHYRNVLRDRLKNDGAEALYRELLTNDPDSAVTIKPRDSIRIVRALEIHHLTGIPASQLRQKKRPAHPEIPILGLRLEREEMFYRAQSNIDQWLNSGWIEEAKFLMGTAWFDPSLPALQALGYKHLFSYLEGRISQEEAVLLIKRDTRRFIKRQLTWFGRYTDIRWVDNSGQPEQTARRILESTF